MDHFLKLPLFFDVQQLQSDLSICEREFWAAHYNKKDYSGKWDGIALRSPDGKEHNIIATETNTCMDTQLLEDCHYFKSILHGFHCELETVRLLALEPGSEIRTHRDRGLSYSEGSFRLHIPIISDPDVEFIVNGCRLEMNPGECWYANFDLPHSVTHRGTTRRVHLIIDGKRNEWTDELFKKAGFDVSSQTSKQVYDVETVSEMIKHLEGMGTETAYKLILELKKQYSV